MRAIIAAVALLTAAPAIAGDLGKCRPSEMEGSWMLLITFRPEKVGIKSEYRCDIKVAKGGRISGSYCSRTYDIQTTTKVKITGKVQVANDCAASVEMTITRAVDWPPAETLSVEGALSVDRSRMTGTYTSTVQPEYVRDQFGRVDAIRLP